MASRRLVALVAGLFVLLCATTRASLQPLPEVAALLDKDSKVYRLVLDRFRELSQPGSRPGVDVVPYLLDTDPANGPTLMAKIQARRPRLIFAIGAREANSAG